VIEVFEFLRSEIASEPTSYLVLVVLVALDGIFPLVPAEIVVMSAALLSFQGQLELWLVFLAGLAGALAGDNLVYLLGKTIGEPAVDKLATSEKVRRRLRWARFELCRHGPTLVVAGRFLPGGRTATNFVSGAVDLSWRRFLPADLVAGALSIGYLVALAYLGGQFFRNHFLPSLGLSIAFGLLLVLVTECIRRVSSRWRTRGHHGHDGLVRREF